MNLIEIATQILTGLLASGDYTQPADRYSSGKPAFYSAEVVDHAIRLAKELMAKTKAAAPASEPAAASPPAEMKNVGNPKIRDVPA